MVTDFSIIEIRIMQNMLAKRPPEFIADILDRSVIEVRQKLSEIAAGFNVLSWQRLEDIKQEKKNVAAAKKNEHVRLKKVQKEQKKKKTVIWREGAQLKKEVSKYATRTVDYNEMISVRIDNKTTIYVKPGEDIELAKKKYLEKLTSSREFSMAKGKTTTEVKKFKPL
jgi:hypothetical protein